MSNNDGRNKAFHIVETFHAAVEQEYDDEIYLTALSQLTEDEIRQLMREAQ